MGINARELRLLIRNTLEYLDDWSQEAENLLLGTAAQESQMGFHLHSNGHRGLGLYGISEAEHREVWDQYLVQYPDLASRVRGLASQHNFLSHPHQELVTNLNYSTAIAWMLYCCHGVKLQHCHGLVGLARCWGRYFHRRKQDWRGFSRNYQQLLQEDNLAAA